MIIFLMLIPLFLVPSNVFASNNNESKLLLIYDSLAKGTPQEGNIESLKRILAALGFNVKLQSIENYQSGELSGYNKLIVVRNMLNNFINDQFEKDLSPYKGAYLHIGHERPSFLKSKFPVEMALSVPDRAKITIGGLDQLNITASAERIPIILHTSGEKYGGLELASHTEKFPYSVKWGQVAFVPYFGTGFGAEISMGYVLADWLGIQNDGQIYLIFKEIYPFSDLKLLESAANQLYEAGIPFIFSIRPVFYNTDYPAMKRYLEVLKYVQSRDGSIFVDAPVASLAAGIQKDLLKEKMTGFIDLLAANGIVPLGIGVSSELYWRNGDQFVEKGMSFFNSAILFRDDIPELVKEAEPGRSFFSSPISVRWNDVISTLGRPEASRVLPLDLAVTFDFATGTAEWEEQLQELKESWISFDDYKYSPHRTETEEYVMESKEGLLFVNKEEISIVHTISSVLPDYEYREKETKSLEGLFKVQNNFYLIVIGVSLLLFSGLFVIGYRLYKRKYLK
ncbi:hypothetical protein [Paenibacillus sp. L3-i20]|uniref:hypothetical protein n=1 Tax=Paenibacillus sp. L3-i20 TaxID=2905833 RepID=UPI0020BDC143|nr:hypothetical protein [Paenibacillus sp. L3-i20]